MDQMPGLCPKEYPIRLKRLTDDGVRNAKEAQGYRKTGEISPTRLSSPTQGIEDPCHEVKTHKHGHPAGGPQAPCLHGVALSFSMKHLLQDKVGIGVSCLMPERVTSLPSWQSRWLRGPCQHRDLWSILKRPEEYKGHLSHPGLSASQPGVAEQVTQTDLCGRYRPSSDQSPPPSKVLSPLSHLE